MSSPFQIVGASVVGDLYDRALSAVYLPERRVYDPSLALRSDEQIYEKIRRDAVIEQALSFRRHLVAGHDWSIVPASDSEKDKLVAYIIEQLIKKIKRFSLALYNLAEATIRGSAYGFIEGKREFIQLDKTNKKLDWWIPTQIRDVDRRRFRQIVLKDHRVIWQIWSVRKMDWENLEHPEWFVKNVYEDTEATLHFGRGLLESLYYYNYFKAITLEKGMQGLERWALGIMQAKIDGLRQAGGTDTTNDAIIQKTLDNLNKMRSQHILAYDKNDEISVLTGGLEGWQIIEKLLEYLDNGIRTLVLGANLPTSADTGGSYALGKIQADSTQAIVSFDRQLLEEAITSDLIGLIWSLNLRNFAELGLANSVMPSFQIVDEKFQNPAEEMNIISTALANGISLRKDEVYEKLGFTIPKEGDEVITKAEAIAPPLPPLSRFTAKREKEIIKYQMQDKKKSNKKSILIIDNGLNADHAYRMAEEGYDVYYYKPYDNTYAKLEEWLRGIRGKIKRVPEWLKVVDEVDGIAVLDIGFADVVDKLQKESKNIIGANPQVEILETQRDIAKQILNDLGISFPESFISKGLDNTLSLLDKLFYEKNWESAVVKVNNYRGDMESLMINKDEYPKLRNSFIKTTLGQVAPITPYLTFIVEKRINGEYVSCDFIFDGKQVLRPYLFGFENNNTISIEKVVYESRFDEVLNKLSVYLRQNKFRGFMSLEAILDKEDGELKIIDITPRFGVPASWLWYVAVKDFHDVLYDLTIGESPVLIKKSNVVGYSACYKNVDKWISVELEENTDMITSPHWTQLDNDLFLVPNKSSEEQSTICVVLGKGDNIKECISDLLQNSKKIKLGGGMESEGISIDNIILDEIKENIEKYNQLESTLSSK